MRDQSRGHVIDLLFTLALFCVFAASSLLVVLIGANVYKGTVKSMDDNFNVRTTLSYIATKVRQNDTAGAFSSGELAGCPALMIDQRIDGEPYRTWIYFDGGAIKEIFAAKDAQVAPEDGQEIAEAGSFSADWDGGSFLLRVGDADGNTAELIVSPRSSAN